MPAKKIKFKLVKFNKQILFQIIDQSGFDCRIEAETNTKIGIFKIKTCSEPEIRIDDYCGHQIFLRGDSPSKDMIVNKVDIPDDMNIDDVYSSIIEALSKVNKLYYQGW